jgi:DNA-binding transcriptional LysR family regulator
MLNLGRLRILREVVRCGSFSGAADTLGYTQSAVSQAIARLEAETGTQLLVRRRPVVRTTVAGAALLTHAETILAEVEAAEQDVAALLGARGGRLRMASFQSAGSTLVPQAIAAFRRSHPEVELSLEEGEPEEIAPLLRAGELDLALLFEFRGQEHHFQGLDKVQLIQDPLWVALAVEHPLARKHHLTLGELRDEDWIQTSSQSACARHTVELCRGAGFTPRVCFQSDDYDTVQGLVAARVGVALVPRLALSRRQPGLVVRGLAPESPARQVFAATDPAAGRLPAAAVMLAILTQRARAFAAGAQA